jgi:UDP-glucose 4-epimerase
VSPAGTFAQREFQVGSVIHGEPVPQGQLHQGVFLDICVGRDRKPPEQSKHASSLCIVQAPAPFVDNHAERLHGDDTTVPILAKGKTIIRDYVHVSDLADAHVAAIAWLAAGNPSNSFNLRNGLGFSVAEVVRTTQKVTGLSVRTEMCPRRQGDPPVLVSDSTKARELLGWIPKIPGLDQQITHAWTWFRDKMPNV